ncbi:hypothetical protein DLM76_00810 [Leptospira yasudae]|nr:hypothetical protein DLM76_00810 [Leptospira yasudae]
MRLIQELEIVHYTAEKPIQNYRKLFISCLTKRRPATPNSLLFPGSTFPRISFIDFTEFLNAPSSLTGNETFPMLIFYRKRS